QMVLLRGATNLESVVGNVESFPLQRSSFGGQPALSLLVQGFITLRTKVGIFLNRSTTVYADQSIPPEKTPLESRNNDKGETALLRRMLTRRFGASKARNLRHLELTSFS